MNTQGAGKSPLLPSRDMVIKALDIYRRHAYEGQWPRRVLDLVPAGDFDTAEWIMGEMVERNPKDAELENVRSAAFRLGNSVYPNMKLRLSLAPEGDYYIFSVDSHDLVLRAEPGTRDDGELNAVKARNAEINDAITCEWDSAGIPTERSYLRKTIRRIMEDDK